MFLFTYYFSIWFIMLYYTLYTDLLPFALWQRDFSTFHNLKTIRHLSIVNRAVPLSVDGRLQWSACSWCFQTKVGESLVSAQNEASLFVSFLNLLPSDRLNQVNQQRKYKVYNRNLGQRHFWFGHFASSSCQTFRFYLPGSSEQECHRF